MTRFRLTENARWYALGLGLAGALALLAVLQYRSNRQLRDGLQKQMRTTLQGSLMNVRFGLEQEFSPICYTLSTPPNPLEDDSESSAREFTQWRRTAVHPALVANVFVYQRAGQPHTGLSQLRQDGNKFEAVDWPADFVPLHGKLDQMAGADSPVSSWLIEENIPALVHPIRGPEKQATQSFLIVQLNLQELSHHILPELAQRYLGSNGQQDYQVALIDRNSDRSLVYSSDGGFGSLDDHAFDA